MCNITGGGITSLLGKGCVKSVQRGKLQHSEKIPSDSYPRYISVPISPVDINKAFLIYDIETENYHPNYDRVISATLTANSISVMWINENNAGTETFVGDWQVVEFY